MRKSHHFLKLFICILFLLQAGENCYAADIAKKFEGVWRRSDSQSSWMEGDVKIDNCIKNSCKVNLNGSTYKGCFCSFEGNIKVTSPNTALFKERNVIIEFRLLDDVSLSIKGESGDWWRWYCGSGANFEGEYRNLKAKYKTGFNCSKAKTKIESLICENKDLANSDYTLSSLYKILKKRNVQELVTSQKEWIIDRDSCESVENPKECLLNKYQERILIFEQYILKSQDNKNLAMTTSKEAIAAPYNFNYLRGCPESIFLQ